MLTLLQDKMDTPLGPLWVLCDEQFNLRAVEWDEHRDRMETLLDVHYRREGYQRVDCRNPGGLSSKLSDYFAGDLAIIETLPTATAGTPFQRQVWQALRDIPCGRDALRPTGRGARSYRRRARGGRRQWRQSGEYRGALPSGHRAQRHHDRLCRRRTA